MLAQKHLPRLNEALWSTVRRIYKDDVLGVAPGGINGQKDHGPLNHARHRVNDAPLKEKQIPGGKLRFLRSVPHPECPAAREYIEVLVRPYMIVRRGFAIYAEYAGTRRLFVRKVGIQQ